MDNIDKRIIIALQKGLPLTPRPYSEMAHKIGVSEDEIILRVKRLNQAGLIKRIDLRLDLKKMGFVTTLVACKVPGEEIRRAKDIILNCGNVTHNYLRNHEFNMWFTLCANSIEMLQSLLVELKKRLKVQQLLSFQTKNVFKLEFNLNVK